jgi:hypothetical protein
VISFLIPIHCVLLFAIELAHVIFHVVNFYEDDNKVLETLWFFSSANFIKSKAG